MYKLTTNISEVNSINNAQSQKEIGSFYCEINKHCVKDLYAIPIIESVLKSYNLDFITENWLSSDIVESIPNDWGWHSPNKNMRFTIPNTLIVKSFKEQNEFNVVMENIRRDSLTDPDLLIIETELTTILYANTVTEENQGIVADYINSGIIKVEIKNI